LVAACRCATHRCAFFFATFLVHFTAAGPDCYSQLLWGISDDPASPRYSDQARYASDKIMPLIPQSRAALQAASAVERPSSRSAHM
jgi:hypothetical protein